LLSFRRLVELYKKEGKNVYIGKLIGVSPQHIIIQSEIGNGFTLDTLPALGDEVLDKTNTTIGKIADIFGPVDRPLFSITPSTPGQLKTFSGSLGDMFYAIKPRQTLKNNPKRKENKSNINRTQIGESQRTHNKRMGSNSRNNYNLKKNSASKSNRKDS